MNVSLVLERDGRPRSGRQSTFLCALKQAAVHVSKHLCRSLAGSLAPASQSIRRCRRRITTQLVVLLDAVN